MKSLFQILLVSLQLLSVEVFSVQMSPRPNFVLIVADDHDRSALGCYGNSQVKTPNLDYLASEGMLFSRAYATTASCSPSRSVILSGRHNHNNGQYGLQQPPHHFHSYPGMKTLSTYLSQAGYRTARIGKYHVAPESSYPFDVVIGTDGSNPVKMAELSGRFFEQNKEQPFFLYFCTTDPHRTGVRTDLPYQPNAHGNRPQGHDGVRETLYHPDSLKVPYFVQDSPESRAELAQYYQSVSRVDDGVGKLIGQLREKGLWNNTVIIYISDNGMPLPGAKTTHYEPGVRLPLIVRNPFAKKKNETCRELVSWLDIAPTLLDFAGIAVPDLTSRTNGATEIGKPSAYLHGKSWKPVFDNPGVFRSDTVFLSHTFHGVFHYYPMRTVVTPRFKLIWNIAYQLPFPFATDLWGSATWQAYLRSGEEYFGARPVNQYRQRPKYELYDLENDPRELNNLAGSPSHQAVVTSLLTSLKSHLGKTGDPWIGKWERD